MLKIFTKDGRELTFDGKENDMTAFAGVRFCDTQSLWATGDELDTILKAIAFGARVEKTMVDVLGGIEELLAQEEGKTATVN